MPFADSLPVPKPIGFPVINLLPDRYDVTSLFPACIVAFSDPLCMTFYLPLGPATCLLLWSFTNQHLLCPALETSSLSPIMFMTTAAYVMRQKSCKKGQCI